MFTVPHSPNLLRMTIPLLPTFLRYANEARTVWNAPLQHEAGEFLCECLDLYFGEGKEWHVYSIDMLRRPLVSFVLKMVDKFMNCISKFPFMKAKK
jgi:hypothetical protein